MSQNVVNFLVEMVLDFVPVVCGGVYADCRGYVLVGDSTPRSDF